MIPISHVDGDPTSPFGTMARIPDVDSATRTRYLGLRRNHAQSDAHGNRIRYPGALQQGGARLQKSVH